VGSPQLKLLNRLNASTRNSSVRVLSSRNTRAIAVSTFQKPGPLMLLAG
jgi:hypothetical protein